MAGVSERSPAEIPIEEQKWRLKSLCYGMDPNYFYPEDGAGVLLAQEVCKHCVVADPCLEYALAKREDHGVWGGKSERERRRILKQRAQASG